MLEYFNSYILYPGGKTIFFLDDLQLHSQAIQLQSRDEINRKFVFRAGELHLVFAFHMS